MTRVLDRPSREVRRSEASCSAVKSLAFGVCFFTVPSLTSCEALDSIPHQPEAQFPLKLGTVMGNNNISDPSVWHRAWPLRIMYYLEQGNGLC
jgi:hypothetical protein